MARRGLHVGWLLLGAAVLGTVVGVALALRSVKAPDAALVESERAAAAVLPLGAPTELALPREQTVDPYAADPKALAGIPPYPGAVPRKLGDGSPLAQKAQMAVAWFETVDSVDAVVAFYEREYSAAKMVYTSHRYSERLGYVGYLDPPKDPELDVTDGLLHLVTAMQQGERTVVLVSALQPVKLLENIQHLPDGVAFPPRASPVRLFDLSEGPQSHQTLASRVKETSLPDAVDFYLRHFEKAGWSITERTEAQSRRTSFAATRGGATQVVMIESKGSDVQVVVSYDQRPTRRAEEPIR